MVITTLICGLIVGYFTSTFLKKKEEKNRITGLIVEKRIESEQNILHFLETSLSKEQMICKDLEIKERLSEISHKYLNINNLQYSNVFKSYDTFLNFYKELDNIYSNNHLWLDDKVRDHLMVMDVYFSCINSLLVRIKNIHIPKDKKLTEKEYNSLCDKIILIYGIYLDNEINGLIAELDVLITNSIYKLDLKCPKYSLSKNGMLNIYTERIIKDIMNHTTLGIKQYELMDLIVENILKIKGIKREELSEEEIDMMFMGFMD